MKLLVTGGTGFLGKRTAAYFRTLGWQVLAPAHDHLDITDPTQVRQWFRENTPDAVIHTAAVSDTGLCQREPEWSERINVTGPVNLAEACREYGAKLVLCSSDQVYSGSPLPGPHRETEALLPNTVYGSQKLRAEKQCLDLLPETVCLRLSWMYSRNTLPGDHGHFLATMKAALSDEAQPLTWPIHDRRGLTDVEDVVRNLPAALELPGGAWNFGCENDSSTYLTVKALLEELGLDSALRRLRPNEATFSQNPRDISMDLNKLHSAGIMFPTTRAALAFALKEIL